MALWAIGLPSPIAWGILAGLMRFVPYVGVFIAVSVPLLIAAAIDPGWTTFVEVLVLFVVGEMTMGQVVEPMVFGRGTGVTPIAVIASTVFWTWLWGPLGLLLAMPMTVCLAVLGRHVEGLEFLDVLLGDEPALTPAQSFYQRALTGDAAEATYQAELALKDQSLACYLDAVALTGLKLAERDFERGAIDGDQDEKISNTVKEMLDNLADFEPRRWFSKLHPAADKNGKDKEETSGMATLAAAENGEDEHGKLPLVERSELAPGWVVDEPILSIGGRNAARCRRRRHAGGRAAQARAGRQGVWARDRLGRAHHLADRDRGEARLPVLSRHWQRSGADPLSGAALAAHPAARHADRGLLLGRRRRSALRQVAVGEHRGRRLRHLAA